jgi:hypothetical protein
MNDVIRALPQRQAQRQLDHVVAGARRRFEEQKLDALDGLDRAQHSQGFYEVGKTLIDGNNLKERKFFYIIFIE